MPVRAVRSNGRNIIGHFPSLKVRRMVAFESTLERDYLYLLDYDPQILTFEEQPLTIPYQHEGQPSQYTPDFLFHMATRRTLVECKPESRVDDDANVRKFAAARAWCAANGYTFQVITDQDMRLGHRLDNIKLLTRYARHSVELDLRARVY